MERECMEKINHYCQKQKFTLVYADVNMTGPSHDPVFTVVVKINDVEYGTGTGRNKKEAKAIAAKMTWEMIEKQTESPSNTQAAELSTTRMTLLPVLSGDYVSQLNMYSQKTLHRVDYPNKCTGDAHAPVVSISIKEVALLGGTFLLPDIRKMAHYKFCFYPCYRKLAANFANMRDKEEIKKMSHESLPGLDTNTSEENESPYTVNRRFLESFKNIEPIGEGGFGNVFKATAKLDERTYAVKRVQFTKNVREVKQLAGLDHKNIVRYYSSWKGYDHVTSPASRQKSDKEILCLFIQMELCEQGPLENWIENNRQDRKYHEMAQMKFLEILEGVEYIHSKGLIHRDLKPQNIFISGEDKIKIGDFGLVTSVTCENLTENTGTKSYMAPEQSGDRYGKEVDIYALGLIWFEILSAFSCHEKTKVWHKVRDGKLPDSFTNQFLTKAPIIKMMLSRDPSGRYSASQILELLKSVDKDKPFRTHTQ
uniref:Interferon-induced, double-stranded RNA-activated protein kinase n=1 Tax=Amazona collaria TaxID=241587 RepID=A0A8B9GJ09_9PSIT